jgi:hypothetical protein
MRMLINTLLVATLSCSAAMLYAAQMQPEESRMVIDDQDGDRAQMERLRRAREREERERGEGARRRDGEVARETEMNRLQMRLSALEREESTLSGQLLSAEQQLIYTRADPADHSAASRRTELQSRLSFTRSQLQQKTAERQSMQRQLESLRFR